MSTPATTERLAGLLLAHDGYDDAGNGRLPATNPYLGGVA